MFTLTGTLHDHSGAPLKGVPVTVVPSPDRTLDPDGNPVRVGVPRDPVVTDADGVFAVGLVTGPDLRYLVTTRLPGWEPVWFDAPEDGTVQDLRDVVPVSAPSEMTSYVRGASAYEVAVAEGFPGTRAEWVASLRGETGPPNSLEIGTVGSGEAAAATITGAAPSQVLDLVLPKGEQGDPGDPGTDVLAEGGVLTFVPRDTTGAPLNVLSVGDVVTGAPGSEAEVSITGTSPGQTLHFVVPRGDEGAASTVPGPPNSLSVGTVTTGAPGTPAAATISGESPSQTLDLTIPQGPVGDPGEAASLAVGTVSTGAPGSAASASITGTAPEQTLNLVIPRGDPGQKGDDSTVPGPPNSLSVGTVTEGPAGASITGAAPEQTLNLTLPRGSTGPANSLEVGTVTTSPPGSQASATISGAAPEQVLDLTIPRGDKGEDSTVPGPPNTLTVGTVTTGAPGSQASATITGTAPSQTLDLAIPQGQPGAPSTVPGPPNTLTVGTVTEGPAGATITGAAPDQTLDLVLPRGNPGPANSLDIGTVTEGPAAASITGTAPSQTLNLVLPRGAKGDPGAVQTVNGQAPDGSGNVVVEGGGGEPTLLDQQIYSLWGSLPGRAITAVGSDVPLAANIAIGSIFRLSIPAKVNMVTCSVRTAATAGATGRVAIYSWEWDGTCTLVQDQGTIAIDVATQQINSNFAGSFLPAGVYVAVFIPEAAVTMRMLSVYDALMGFQGGQDFNAGSNRAITYPQATLGSYPGSAPATLTMGPSTNNGGIAATSRSWCTVRTALT